MAGLHIPTLQSLISWLWSDITAMISDLQVIQLQGGMTLKPKSKWQPPDFNSSIPSAIS